MADAPLFLEDLPEEGKIVLTHKSGTWTSYSVADLSLSGQATFGAPLEDYNDRQQEFLNKWSTVAGTIGIDLPISSVKNLEQTVQSWNSSDGPNISVEMTFITLSDNDTTAAKATSLSSLVFPRSLDRTIGALGRPAGYANGLQGDGGVAGTFMLEMGSWFRAPYLILVSADLTYSSQQTRSGQPLWCTVGCTLEPYRMITEDVYLDWFLKR